MRIWHHEAMAHNWLRDELSRHAGIEGWTGASVLVCSSGRTVRRRYGFAANSAGGARVLYFGEEQPQ